MGPSGDGGDYQVNDHVLGDDTLFIALSFSVLYVGSLGYGKCVSSS